MSDLTRNDFLGGQVRLWQPVRGYRAGVDPVLLAAACPAQKGEAVLELGCGAGAAMLCLAARTGAHVVGVEREPLYAGLARRNLAENRAEGAVVEADISALPPEVKARRFDHVIFNPPYFDRSKSSASPDAPREAAMGEETPLDTWLEVAAKRLRPGGSLTVIQRAERLDDLLAGFRGRLGSVTVLPIAPRQGRDARLVIVAGLKGGGAALRLLAPLVLHEGARHERDGEDYTLDTQAILRRGAAICDGKVKF